MSGQVTLLIVHLVLVVFTSHLSEVVNNEMF
jgi:hypothetical protein